MKGAIKFAIIALAATTTNAQTEDDLEKTFEAIGMLPAPGKISSTVSGTYGIGPNYTLDEAALPCSECKRGRTFTLHMPIANTTYNCDPVDHPLLSGSKICGDGNCGQIYGEMGIRNITVYIPAAYKDGDEVGVMVLQDGESMLPIISNVMDRFIGSDDDEHSLPTFVVVAVAVAGPDQLDYACKWLCIMFVCLFFLFGLYPISDMTKLNYYASQSDLSVVLLMIVVMVCTLSEDLSITQFRRTMHSLFQMKFFHMCQITKKSEANIPT